MTINFSDLKVFVIGDIGLDIIEKGISTRNAPESDVPVILNPTQSFSLGMAGNVALNLHQLGANVDYSFVIGEDMYGVITNNILEKKIGITNIYKDKLETLTIVKKRIFANDKQVARIDFEEIIGVEKLGTLINGIKYKVERQLKYDLIIISDYNKGIISDESWKIMRPLLEQLSDNFFVDTKKTNVIEMFEGMHIFPNEKEMAAIISDNDYITKKELKLEMDLPFLITTASEKGAYIHYEERDYNIPTFKVDGDINVYGAGDVFISAFSLYYTKYKNELDAIQFANYCCSKAIKKEGTCNINLHEVQDFEA